MSAQEKAPFMAKAVDLSHHLSDVAKARELSPLKKYQKYFKPGVISLAGGKNFLKPSSTYIIC
jgi:aromatic amino acid aminotransferase I